MGKPAAPSPRARDPRRGRRVALRAPGRTALRTHVAVTVSRSVMSPPRSPLTHRPTAFSGTVAALSNVTATARGPARSPAPRPGARGSQGRCRRRRTARERAPAAGSASRRAASRGSASRGAAGRPTARPWRVETQGTLQARETPHAAGCARASLRLLN